jgi:hypothetical protein
MTSSDLVGGEPVRKTGGIIIDLTQTRDDCP